MQPFFSIIIPLYNKEEFIHETISSVLNQTYKNFEIIVVNDGSTDNSLSIARGFTDPRINILEQENLGLSQARNNGIKISRYNFIAFLDADDLWRTNYLECIVNLISKYNNSFVFATKSKPWYKKHLPPLTHSESEEKPLRHISDYFKIKENIFSYSSIVFNKSVFEDIGNFNEEVTFGEEEDLTIRLFLNYYLAYCNYEMVYYRKGLKNQLTTPNSKFHKIIPDYTKYVNNENRLSLTPYLDFVHFKLVVLFKMERNYKLVKFYKAKINVANLTLVQKIKFYLPIQIFYYVKSIYIWFSKRLIHS